MTEVSKLKQKYTLVLSNIRELVKVSSKASLPYILQTSLYAYYN